MHKLVVLGKQRFESRKREIVRFEDDDAENIFLNDLENTPHAFVLAGLMSRQMKAEKAWHIPYIIKGILGDFSIDCLAQVTLEEYLKIFKDNQLHRFNPAMSEIFYCAVHRIKDVYDGDVSMIWKDCPSSAKVVYDFLQFKGAGIKIATMLTNILVRDFLVPYSDYYSIDISPDTHVMRIMKRTGLVSTEADRESVIYKARELYPEYPGIIDYSCWEIGRSWCHPQNPDCSNCVLNDECKKCIIGHDD